MNRPADLDLLEAYLAGELSAADVAALEQRLTTEPALADLFLTLAREEAILSEWARSEVVGTEIASQVVPSSCAAPRVGHRLWRWVPATLTTAIAFLLAITLPERPGPHDLTTYSPEQAVLALVEDAEGEVFVVSERGEPVVARRGQPLRPGQGVRTRGEGSSAVVMLADARRVELGMDTTVRLIARPPTATDVGPKLYLEEGTLAPAAAQRGEDRPMIVTTAQEWEVRVPADARAQITSDAQGMRVETEQGRSQVVNRRDGRASDVPSGWFAVAPAQGSGQVALQPLPPVVTQARRVLREGIPSFQTAAYSPDGHALALGSTDGRVRLLNLTTHRVEVAPVQMGKMGIRALAFSPTGSILAAAADERQVKLLAATSGMEQTVLRGCKTGINCLAFSPDGSLLATGGGSKNAEIKVWLVDAQLELATLPGHGQGILALAFSPDAHLLASAGRDGSVKLWDLTDAPREYRTLAAHSTAVCSVAFSPDGTALATAGKDLAVKLWDPETGQERRTFTGLTGDVRAVAFSPDGKWLAAADSSIRIWDMATGQQQVIFKGHRGGVCAMRFTADGQQLTTAGWDRTIRIWDVPR